MLLGCQISEPQTWKCFTSVFIVWFVFFFFSQNSSFDSPSPEYLGLFIDLNSLKGINIFLMSLSPLGDFVLLVFLRFEGF